MVGIQTVLSDNPRLTARLDSINPGSATHQPIPIVMDSHFRIPRACHLLNPDTSIGARMPIVLVAREVADVEKKMVFPSTECFIHDTVD